MGYIYKITNTVNGKVYIGQTRRDIKSRWKEHKHISPSKRNHSRYVLTKAIEKYGADAFTIEQLEECENALLDEREVYWIAEYNSTNKEIGYNISKGGIKFNRECEPIVQFDIYGNYIQTFPTIYEASLQTGHKASGIYNVCSGWANQHEGYQWRYLKDAEKIGMKLSKCTTPKKSKVVHQYSLEGDYIKSFPSLSMASRSFGDRNTSSIRMVCKGKMLVAYGYRWNYEKVDKLPPMRKNRIFRSVAKLDDDGNVIKVYEKMTDAAKENGRQICAIQSACSGLHKKCAGYYWKYLNKEN